ncbi:C6 zinc finger domain-containing protein [Rhizodiscina lignyota]|uniref:C6 zinc finger domain-containing protein n=1 Tax=Rhizodiscina lignyota TaxID=1504668 RepID=A0A9P4I351_9PEZI|nr:C6 zinc finger domain-containing protein [Rhizodiscina lignyota]
MLTPQTPDSWPTHDVDTTAYGYDLGKPDEDVPKNNDADAIRVIGSPEAKRLPFPSGGFFFDGHSDEAEEESKERPIAFNRGGYYAKPVGIRIPKALEPLPSKLMENPMNLLYFHHFLNHTARILVPHDCEQNPFRNILPQMAVQDDNILNLMLAYSAAHRARLLQHPEPQIRIAEYVQDVFPKLRHALTSTAEQVSTTNLASAIMLASLEIMSPNTFALQISWQNHLTIAREMIFARGGPQSVHKKDKVSYFLSRWFAYLDVLGSLSGSKNDWPLSSNYWSTDGGEIEDDFQIDCLMGFTSRCVSILARIAELAKSCEKERIDVDGNVNHEWRPSGDVVTQAEELKRQLQEGRGHVSKACTHRRANISESEMAWDSLEIYATNEAFHWAGLIHLTRRVLGRPASDPEVQNAVREIIGALYKVRRGSTAESCLLFPMFTAGCDALDNGQRGKIMERLRSVEAYGMTHVKKARRLMEKVWDTGKPWESMGSDEFFG